MKYVHRSATAIVAATLVGGAGIAAAVTGLTGASATPRADQAKTHVVDAAQRRELSKALAKLSHNDRRLEQQLLQARHELARQNAELRHQRALARIPVPAATPAYPSGSYSTGSGAAVPSTSGAPPAPPTDTTTGASGGAGGGEAEDDERDGSDDGASDDGGDFGE